MLNYLIFHRLLVVPNHMGFDFEFLYDCYCLGTDYFKVIHWMLNTIFDILSQPPVYSLYNECNKCLHSN